LFSKCHPKKYKVYLQLTVQTPRNSFSTVNRLFAILLFRFNCVSVTRWLTLVTSSKLKRVTTHISKLNGLSFFLFTGSLLFLIHYTKATGQSQQHQNVETAPWHDRQERTHPEESQVLAILRQSTKRYVWLYVICIVIKVTCNFFIITIILTAFLSHSK